MMHRKHLIFKNWYNFAFNKEFQNFNYNYVLYGFLKFCPAYDGTKYWQIAQQLI